MKIPLVNPTNVSVGDVELPVQFSEEYRPDVIARAVLAIQNNRRQPYGAKPEAGKRSSAKLSRRRKDYRGAYGIGISRVPRKIMTRRGTRMNWVAAFAPGTVGGREAHPPKASKKWGHVINRKERLKAIRSAIAATLNTELVTGRGHKVPSNYPFIVEDGFEQLSKTKEVTLTLEKLGFGNELSRGKITKIRAGKGKVRGRKIIRKKSLLIVTGSNAKISRAAYNIPGVDIVNVKNLNVMLLAPGTMPGRITLWTRGAIEQLAKEKLFMGT